MKKEQIIELFEKFEAASAKNLMKEVKKLKGKRRNKRKFNQSREYHIIQRIKD